MMGLQPMRGENRDYFTIGAIAGSTRRKAGGTKNGRLLSEAGKNSAGFGPLYFLPASAEARPANLQFA
jgi:hypothetical protein